MGGWKRTAPTVYFVAWPDGVFKVGYSQRQRWRRFVLRGARIIRLAPCATSAEAFALETACHEVLLTSAPTAWAHLADSTRHLGTDGGGYAECFRLIPDQMRNACERIANASCERIAHELANALCDRNANSECTDGRTHVLTEMDYSPLNPPETLRAQGGSKNSIPSQPRSTR